jgi:hypothetical protein
MELLTGIPAVERDASGEFPADTFNRLVESRLADFAERLQAYSVAGYTPA